MTSGLLADFLLPPAPSHTHRSPRLSHRLLPGAPPAAVGCCPSSETGTVLEGEEGAALAVLREGASSHLTPSGPRSATSRSLTLPFWSVGYSLFSSMSLFSLFLPSESLYISLHFWLCLTVCVSLSLSLLFSVSLCLCLTSIALCLNSAQTTARR